MRADPGPFLASGIGLSGESDQRFKSASQIEDDDLDAFVTIYLRLGSFDSEPRPLFGEATKIPPPLSRSL